MGIIIGTVVDLKMQNERGSVAAGNPGLDELQSLGIDPKRESDINDKHELEELAWNIKQSMYVDYKLAYGEKGEGYEQEAMATVNV